MSKKFIVLSVLVILFSCSDVIYKQLGRPLADPEIVPPAVAAFRTQNTIVISWEADNAADEYILYRRYDIAGSTSESLYRGTALEYCDTDGNNEDRYLYSLSKIRGQREFGPSEEVLGVFSNTIRDFSEPNNTKEEATYLLADLEANMYYYKAGNGSIIQDDDWYYIEVPPRRVAHLTVNQDGIIAGNTCFYFSQETEIPFRIVNAEDIAVQNYNYSMQKIYFKIYPVTSEFLNEINPSGGSIVGYTLSLVTITGI